MTILMPLPLTDFDPTESAIPWKVLKENGIKVVFASPGGKVASADSRMLTGAGLGPWKFILRADKNAQLAYQEMIQDKSFLHPISWENANTQQSALLLAGGHAPGMKNYLESETLQNLVAAYFDANKVVGAICHGVVLAARSKKNGKSILQGRKTTALLYSQEMMAWSMTCLWLGSYYRTYPESVQGEVTRMLASPKDFVKGPTPVFRDSQKNLKPGFVLEDGNYISARWPGDAHSFANALVRKIKN